MADARARALSGSDASTAHSAAADAALAQHANAHAPTHAPASPPAQQPKPKPASAPAADDGKPSKLPPKPKPSRVRTEIPRYRWTGRPFDLPAGGMHQVVRERRQRLAARLESSSDVFLQGFHWESHKQRWYKVVEKKIPLMQDLGISGVWLPPPSQSVAVEGYLPQNFYSLDSKYGSADDLKCAPPAFAPTGTAGSAAIWRHVHACRQALFSHHFLQLTLSALPPPARPPPPQGAPPGAEGGAHHPHCRCGAEPPVRGAILLAAAPRVGSDPPASP